MANVSEIELPGLDCGLCGFPSCDEMASRLDEKPELLKRCIPLSADSLGVRAAPPTGESTGNASPFTPPLIDPAGGSCAPSGDCGGCAAGVAVESETKKTPRVVVGGGLGQGIERTWTDHLGRDVDFVLDSFPEEAGPREMVIPHNPVLTRELDIQPGEILVGRPLGISCGCPVTHCGIVTGPLHPRQHGFKDIGYYSAQAYEGLIKARRIDVEIGRRYWFQPRMCMMQWRHSGLVNFINRGQDGLQVRIEGLWIG
jgi:uncharacterized Fe-S cluster-containing protein